jgi:hypothetical protein
MTIGRKMNCENCGLGIEPGEPVVGPVVTGKAWHGGLVICKERLKDRVAEIETDLKREILNREQAHKIMTDAGVAPAAWMPCKEGHCDSHLTHRVADLVNERDVARALVSELQAKLAKGICR